jgi:energy-coupling factor transport system ATP-binding protein
MTSGENPPALVRLERVHWRADLGLPTERAVLSHVDLGIAPGERVGLVGRSGSGKTTLASILAGLVDPAEGRIFDSGRERPRGALPAPGAIGVVFQDPETGFFEETVASDVAFGPRTLGLREADALHRAEEALRLVGLEPRTFAARAPETLSGGEARRAAIAGVLAFRPKLVVFDEPTTGLDAEGLDRVRSILESIHARGAAYLVVSHDLPFLLEHCDRIAMLEQGTIAWDGPATDLVRMLPESWAKDLARRGGELIALAQALRDHGWIGDDVPPTPEALARAWTAAAAARRN